MTSSFPQINFINSNYAQQQQDHFAVPLSVITTLTNCQIGYRVNITFGSYGYNDASDPNNNYCINVNVS